MGWRLELQWTSDGLLREIRCIKMSGSTFWKPIQRNRLLLPHPPCTSIASHTFGISASVLYFWCSHVEIIALSFSRMSTAFRRHSRLPACKIWTVLMKRQRFDDIMVSPQSPSSASHPPSQAAGKLCSGTLKFQNSARIQAS